MAGLNKSPSGKTTRISGQLTVDLPSAGAAAVTLASIAITGVLPGDSVLLTPVADLSVAIGIMPGYCLVAGTAKFPLVNPTAGALDAASQLFNFQIIRRCDQVSA